MQTIPVSLTPAEPEPVNILTEQQKLIADALARKDMQEAFKAMGEEVDSL